MNLSDLMEEIFRINTNNGWFDSERSFGEDIALLVGEASEAHEQYRKGRDLGEIYGICKSCNNEYTLDVMMLLGVICSNKDCRGFISPEGVPVELIDVIVRALDSLKRVGVTNPDFLMTLKLDYNSKRGYRHGGKTV